MAPAANPSDRPPQPEGQGSDRSSAPAPHPHPHSSVGRYLDFEVEIAPGTGRSYPLAVTSSPAGEARETMTFPYDELALESRLKTLRLALLRSGGARRDILTPEEDEVRTFGQSIFDALLVGRIRGLYEASYQLARSAGKGLRLKLRVLPPELACLPWEYVYDPHRAEYLGLSRDTPIVRFVEVGRPIEPLLVEPPLRILAMVAGPSNLPELDTERERSRIEQAVGPLQTRGLLELTWLEGQTWRDLQAAMRQGPWHVFHFVGHGDFDPSAGEGVVALCDDHGKAHHLSATELGRLLADHHALRLVLLNSCEGARGSARDLFSSTAAILVRRGLPAVLAMQDEITDRAAVEFSRAFYEALADGYPVDAAVAEARKAVSLAVTNTLEWGTPVLYTRAPEGVVFDIPTARPVERRLGGPGVDDERAARVDELYTEALSAYWVEDWDRACTSLQELIALDPEHPGARSRLDEALRRHDLAQLWDSVSARTEAGDWGAAIAALEEIVDLDPDDDRAEHQLLAVRRQQRVAELFAEAKRLHDGGRWEAVTKVVAEIVDLDPGFTEARPLADSAEEHLVEVRRRQHLDERYRQALDDMDASRWAEAGLALSEIVDLEPDYRDVAGLLARCRSQLEQEQARRDRAAGAEERYRAAVAHLADERWQEALDTMAAVLDLEPEHGDPEDVAGRADRALAAEKLAGAGSTAATPPLETPPTRASAVTGESDRSAARPSRVSRLVLVGAVAVVLAAVGAWAALGGGDGERSPTTAGGAETVSVPAGPESGDAQPGEPDETGPAVPDISDEFDGRLFDDDTWERFGQEVTQSDGIVTIVHGAGGEPAGFVARAEIGLARAAEFTASVRLDETRAPPDEANMAVGLQIGPMDLKCGRSRFAAWCWNGNSATGEHQELVFDVPDDEWVDYRIRLRPEDGEIHYFVNGRHIGSLAIPDDLAGQTGHFVVSVYNESDVVAVAGLVERVAIRPLD